MAGVRVQSIAGSGLKTLPPQFVRPQHERPTAAIDGPSAQVPLIDLSNLGEDVPVHLRQQTLAELATAAQQWGLFQILNHGISEDLIQRLQAVGREFFELPQEEKEAYANNAAAGVMEGYGTKLAHQIDGKLEWIDYYFHMLWPPSCRDLNTWPKRPASYIDVNDEYARALVGVVNTLLSALSINLGLAESAMKEALGGDLEMEMKINYYPPCPQPELALGVEAHTDMSALTLLVPNEVPGLQVFKDGCWVSADYVPNAIIVHIGDQLEILSNGKYKSVLHRSLVSKDKVRMSWPVFCTPPADTVIGPMKGVVNEENPPRFNAKTYAEFKHRKINKLPQ
uniref:TSA: Wollemia nobilis Ref_Wollemi_Transcript_14054_1376 transcribed RNA sequence n=1 Tax=Wollemia nobilis TaxID=56998 RepID=A0A0C9RK12_9CONI